MQLRWAPPHRRIQELKLGDKVEHRRREKSRGAEGAKAASRVEVVCGEGCPFSTGGLERKKKFLDLKT